MKKTSLLFLAIFAIVALLILAGFLFLAKEQPMPQVQTLPPSPSEVLPEHAPAPIPSTGVQPSPNPAATWKTYRNERYGFEAKYPNTYGLENRDTAHSIPQSRYILLDKGSGDMRTSITIEIISPREEKDVSFHLGMTDLTYVSYIKDPAQHEKVEFITIGDQVAPIFFFGKENPGELGDFRNTIVVILEHGDILFVIKKVPASELDAEFKRILSTLRF